MLALKPLALALLLLNATGTGGASTEKPHVLLLVLDDFGWANAGWHRTPGAPGSDEVITPNLNALVRAGVELNRSYVYQFCSPSRSALQSGRNPVHVNLYNQAIPLHNPKNVESGGMGMARNMTGIALKMREGGYATHQFGKWGIGCLSPGHTPLGRGFDTSFGYFDHTLDYWTEKAYEQCPTFQTTDLWASDGPAYGVNGSFSCSQANQGDCTFLDTLIVDRLLATIAAHDPAQPLFLYWAPHATHSPLEVPTEYYDRFPFVNSSNKPSNFRRLYDALTNFIDEAVGNVTRALRAKGMWENCLVVATTDNGGPIDPSSGPATGANGANNWPLRGGKVSNWEGGIRGNAFVSGGFVPPAARGTARQGLIGIEDWYPTLCGLAGVPVHDGAAARAGLPPVDGVDQWAYLSGANSTPPRSEWLIGSPYPIPGPPGMGNGTVQGIISPPWKFVIGNMTRSVWLGPIYPNASTDWDAGALFDCGDPLLPNTVRPGCLFDVYADQRSATTLQQTSPALCRSCARG